LLFYEKRKQVHRIFIHPNFCHRTSEFIHPPVLLFELRNILFCGMTPNAAAFPS